MLTPTGQTPEGLESIIGPIIGFDDPAKRLVTVLVCYLDDSGTGSDSPVLTMAGYVGFYNAWYEFEQKAKEIFAAYNVKLLHGKEFDATKHDFKGWARTRKEGFVARLYLELQKAASFGMAYSVTKTAYHKARVIHSDAPQLSAYGYCFGRVLDHIMRSELMMRSAADLQATISFVVEGGNKNDADILRVFNDAKFKPENIGVDKVMKSMSFVDKNSSVCLQMADFLAFHSRRYAFQCEKAKAYLPKSDLQRVIFEAVPTYVSVSHEYRSNEEIAKGYKDPLTWRDETEGF